MNKQIIEINGAKIEVDFDKATKIDTFKIGDNVKIFHKEYTTSTEYKVFPAIIVGFTQTDTLIAIECMMMKYDYNGVTFKSIYFTNDAKMNEDKINILAAVHEGEMLFSYESILDKLDSNINVAEIALSEAKNRKEYFLKYYQKIIKDTQ